MTHTPATAAEEQAVVHSSFDLDRFYPHAPAKVFAAFADATKKRRWFTEGEGWEVFEYTLDFRVGGAEVSRFRFKDGPEIRNDTLFQDIVDDRLIVFTYRMAIGPKPISVSLSTVLLTPRDGGTLYSYTEQGVYFDGAEKGRKEGSVWLLDSLEVELQR